VDVRSLGLLTFIMRQSGCCPGFVNGRDSTFASTRTAGRVPVAISKGDGRYCRV
jgi:hypothetical protein